MSDPGENGRAYQRLINLVPLHDIFTATHLGGGAVMTRKRRAARNLGLDTDYPSEAYAAALGDPDISDYPNCTQTGLVTEPAWTNLPPPVVLHDYDHIGMDFREREALRRRSSPHVRKLQRAPVLERNAILANLADVFLKELKLVVGRCLR